MDGLIMYLFGETPASLSGKERHEIKGFELVDLFNLHIGLDGRLIDRPPPERIRLLICRQSCSHNFLFQRFHFVLACVSGNCF
jgi:hypothetical protein